MLQWSSMAREQPSANSSNAPTAGAPWALVIGDQEAEQGCVRLKSLDEAGEQIAALDAIPALLRPWGNP